MPRSQGRELILAYAPDNSLDSKEVLSHRPSRQKTLKSDRYECGSRRDARSRTAATSRITPVLVQLNPALNKYLGRPALLPVGFPARNRHLPPAKGAAAIPTRKKWPSVMSRESSPKRVEKTSEEEVT